MCSKQLLVVLSTVILVSSSAITNLQPTPTITHAPALLEARETITLHASSTSSSTTATDFYSTRYLTIDEGQGRQSTQTIIIKLPSAPCTQTITPDKNGYVPPGTCGALYDYYPSFGAAIAAAVIFGLLFFAHIVQAFWWKTAFCWVIIVGAGWETLGFAARAVSTRHQQNVWLELSSDLFVLLSPLWVNAFDYMVLARLIHFFAPTKKVGFLKPSIMAMVFVLLDFVSFVIQLIGGSMAGPNSPKDQQFKSVHIYMGGIGLQQFFILIFLGIAFWFHRDMLRAERAGMLQGEKQYWRKLLFALYLSLVAISTRIIFRLIEFSSGLDSNNRIIYNEWYIYVFDAGPMIIAIAIWNAFHPGTRLQGPDAHFPQNWLVRHICCCCIRKRDDAKPYRQEKLYPAGGDDEEMAALAAQDSRGRNQSAATLGNDLGRGPSRSPSPWRASRDPSPYRPAPEYDSTNYDAPPQSYEAYRGQV